MRSRLPKAKLVSPSSIPAGLFSSSKPKKTSSEQMDVTEIIKVIEEFYPANLSADQKINLANGMKAMWEKEGAKIHELTQVVDQQIQQKKSNVKQASQDKGFGISDFMKILIGTLSSAKFGPLMLLAGAAAQTLGNYWVVEGQPSGGTDLCSSVIGGIGCKQGYLTNSTDPNAWAAQFSRIVSATNDIAPDVTNGYYVQLRDCVSLDKIGDAILNSGPELSKSTATSCYATSNVWHNYQVQTIVKAPLSPQNCQTLQNQLQVDFAQCQDTAGAILKGGAIAGIVIGSLAFLACCVAGVYYCCNNRNQFSLSSRV